MNKNQYLIDIKITITLFVILLILLTYTTGYFNAAPYSGFRMQNSNGRVNEVYDAEQAHKISPNDQVISINTISVSLENAEEIMDLWKSMSPGDTVKLEVLQNGVRQTVEWEFSGWTKAENNARLASQWFMPYFFFLIGVIVFTSVRPRDRLWRLLFTFSLITALWLVVGSGPSRYFLWGANDLLPTLSWFMIATLIELHWVFPTPFKHIPKWMNTVVVSLLHAGAVILSIYEYLYAKEDLYIIGILSSFVLSMILIGIHYISQKKSRNKIRIVARMTGVALLPFLILAIVEMFNIPVDKTTQAGALLGLPLLPLGYLFAIWQGNLTNIKFRANRFLSIYIYIMLIITIFIPILGLITDYEGKVESMAILLIIPFLSVVILLSFYPFQRLVERYILRIPIPRSELLETYSSAMSNTQNADSISTIMGKIVLPSLMIRQSLLIEFQSASHVRVMNSRNVAEYQIPTSQQVNQMLSFQQTILTGDHKEALPENLQWINVVMPLYFDGEMIGIWLLGQRDPDDIYDPELIRIIQAIAQQTAIAIINHQRSTRLRILYEANINRSEAERASLARDLHDDTLNELALLQRKFPDEELSASLTNITSSLRKVIHGLRPTVLSYGLQTALHDLADTLNEIQGTETVTVSLESSPHHLSPDTELHIFRIIQQACENALQHADAENIQISGTIHKDLVMIAVVDDGKGFKGGTGLDLMALVQENHFGMAGMHERATLIGASLDVQTAPGKGTKVILELKTPPKDK